MFVQVPQLTSTPCKCAHPIDMFDPVKALENMSNPLAALEYLSLRG